MKINLCANIFGESGFAVHGRHLARALKEEGIDLGIETYLPPNYMNTDEWIEFRENIEKNYAYENTVMISAPEYWEVKAGDKIKNFIPIGIFEGTQVSPNWIRIAEKDFVTKLIVPSEHTKKAFESWQNEKVNKKLVIIPHGVSLNIFKPIERPKNEKFRFLFVGGWKTGIYDRKGLDIALKAFCAEFKPEEPVEFFIKFNMAYQDQNTVINNLNALNLPLERPKISLSFDQISEEKLVKVYQESDCFVMPTKGEAFCMPCLEALATGLPVIATDFGGQTDYLPKEGLIKVEKFIPATAEPWIYEWAKWAIPSQSHLQELMRKAFNGELKGNLEITKNYSWNNEAKKIVELL